MNPRKEETISIRTTAEVKHLLKLAAIQQHRSVASMVEVLVLEHAQKQGLKTVLEAPISTGARKKPHGTD